jgi:hypothetical protein
LDFFDIVGRVGVADLSARSMHFHFSKKERTFSKADSIKAITDVRRCRTAAYLSVEFFAQVSLVKR